MIDTADLNRRICEFALARMAAMGEAGGGLFNYYGRLAENGTILRREEIAVADYIARAVPAHKAILELCAGAAQLGHMLSLQGRTISAVEIDPHRYDFAVDLGKHLGSRCDVLFGGWQSLQLANWQLLVTLNAASSHVFPADTAWLQAYAKGGGEFIIRPRQFGPGIDVDIPGLQATLVHEDVYHYRAA